MLIKFFELIRTNFSLYWPHLYTKLAKKFAECCNRNRITIIHNYCRCSHRANYQLTTPDLRRNLILQNNVKFLYINMESLSRDDHMGLFNNAANGNLNKNMAISFY
jgi:hypothetical protein